MLETKMDLEEVICREILMNELLEIKFNSLISLEEFLDSFGRKREYVEEVAEKQGLAKQSFVRKQYFVRSQEQRLFRSIRNNKKARQIMKELGWIVYN